MDVALSPLTFCQYDVLFFSFLFFSSFKLQAFWLNWQAEKTFYFGKFKIDPTEVFFSTQHSYAFVNLKPVVPGMGFATMVPLFVVVELGCFSFDIQPTALMFDSVFKCFESVYTFLKQLCWWCFPGAGHILDTEKYFKYRSLQLL